jgi:ABC-type polysaccharide/polyol phosphate transport system ATPase subunit
MSENSIVVDNLSKRYLIGHQSSSDRKSQYPTLREVVERQLNSFARKAADVAHGRQVVQGDEIEEFWALRDVSFKVKQGEVLGIIGRNGAGKSTLLKILSRITEPTEGRVLLRGRVASLLEVGTGFHPELSGRENIFLNGAILGMARWELRKKFDEIVEFAEVTKFIDTPVKRYSSGMYVRLAFAVAAHLEPEILIVDEVLAVGDTEFQKKCLGKMSEVARQHRTVLFVSHNMGAVKSLTKKCIWIDQGSIVKSGDTEEVIASYFVNAIEVKREAEKSNDLTLFRRGRIDDHAPAKITGIVTGTEESSSNLPVIRLGDSITIKVKLTVHKVLDEADLRLIIRTSQGEPVVALTCADQNYGLSLEPGHPTVEVTIADLPLVPGTYYLDLAIDQVRFGKNCDFVGNYPLLSVVNDGQITHWLGRPWGVVQCQQVQWNVCR